MQVNVIVSYNLFEVELSFQIDKKQTTSAYFASCIGEADHHVSFICKISGILLWHLYLRTSWVRTF